MGRPHGEAGIRASGLVLPLRGWATWRELSVGIFMDTMSRLNGPSSTRLASVQ